MEDVEIAIPPVSSGQDHLKGPSFLDWVIYFSYSQVVVQVVIAKSPLIKLRTIAYFTGNLEFAE